MRLVVDAGNTAVKLGLAHDGGIWTHERIAPDPAALDAFLRPHRAAVDEALVLAGGRTAEVVLAWLESTGLAVRRVGRELALPACEAYPGLGYDRIAAGVVAVAQERRDLILIDAGTAVTLGAWAWRDGRASFVGGLILPGAWACAQGLAHAAPALPVAGPAPGPAAARSTAEALAVALHRGHPAMVAACLEALSAETGISHRLVTGGGAAALVAAGIVPAIANRPSLLLEGIELLAGW